MQGSFRQIGVLVFALLCAVPLLLAWANDLDHAPVVTALSSEEADTTVILVSFPADKMRDVRNIHFLFHGGDTPIHCNRVYYLGPTASGTTALVGYKLSSSSTNESFVEPSEPLSADHVLTGAPLPVATVVCTRFMQPQELILLSTISTDEYPPSTANAPPGRLDSVPELCQRFTFGFEEEHALTPEQADSATADAVAAFQNAFSLKGALDSSDSSFRYHPSESALRACWRREPDGQAEVERFVVVALLEVSPNSVVESVLLPALLPHLGDATTIGRVRSQAVFLSDFGYKCPGRPHLGGDPSASRCVYERCTSPPVLTSPIGCYFGTTEVPEAECGNRERPVPVQRDCRLKVVDLGINSAFEPELDAFALLFQIFFSADSDLSLDDFPSLKLVFGLPGFELSQVKSFNFFDMDSMPTGLPSGLVTYSPTSITIDLASDVNGFFLLLSDASTIPVWDANIFFSTNNIYFKHSNTLVYSSDQALPAPGVVIQNPSTGTRELLFKGGKVAQWESGTPRKFFGVVLRGNNLSNITCSAAQLPSNATVASEILRGDNVNVLPKVWKKSTTGAGINFFVTLMNITDLVGDDEDPSFVLRCIIDTDEPITAMSQMYMSDQVAYSVRPIDITAALPVPEGFVGQLQLNLDGAELESVVAALTDAFAIPDSSAEVKVLSVPEEEGSNGSHVAVMRLSPLLSYLLPSAIALEAALPALTGAQLVLPGGANASDVSHAGLYQAVEEGHWLCGSNGSYSQCDLAVANCGDSYSAPLRCAQSSAAIDPAASPFASAVACAFDDSELPVLPQTDGCGSLSCKLPGTDGAIVPCNDARVCLSLEGCAVDVAITEELISETEALQPVCVKGSDIVDMAYCPASLVPAVEHVSTCNATADCGAVCFSEATGKRVNCDDAWSSCPVTCNGGTRTRAARCADVSVPIGDDAAPEVPVALCPNGELGLELSDMCEGDVALCPGPTVNATAADEPGVYTVTWDDAAGKANVETGEALVELVPSGAAANDTIVLGTAPVSDFSLSFNVGELGIPAGVYTAVVTFDGVLRGESAEFDILSLCAAECLNGGTCNTATGVCDCVGDWSGDACSISPCVAKGCNAGGSTCSVDEGGFAQCECKGDWSGEACSVSPCDSKGCDDEHTSACTVTPAGFAQCNCKGEWSGETCTQSPCVAKGCNPEGSECTVTEANTAQCRCFTDNEGAPLFYGTKCDIPADYCEVQAPPCSNGGTRSGEFHSNGSFVCTDCACKQAWESATDCATCGLNCAHNTMANADCATCNCPFMGGYSGNLCECRSAYMTFIVRDKDVSQANINAAFDRIHGPDTGASFTEKLSLLFASDLASVTNIRSVQPAVTVATRTSPAGTRYYEIIFSVGPACNGVVPVQDDRMIPTYDAIVALKPFLSAGSHTRNNLVALSALHAPSGFAAHDPNCQLGEHDCPSGWAGNGVFVEADGALDCKGADAGNPACPDDTNKGGDSGLSTGAIVGIAVGGSIALLLILLLVFWAAGIFCFAASKTKRRSTEIPMTSV